MLLIQPFHYPVTPPVALTISEVAALTGMAETHVRRLHVTGDLETSAVTTAGDPQFHWPALAAALTRALVR